MTAVASPRSRLVAQLASSTMGVYLLIAVGVTAALAEAVAALGDLPLAVALTHREAALVVALLLVSNVASALRADTSRRVRAALAAAAALYPAQIAVGAATALTGATTVGSALHLVLPRWCSSRRCSSRCFCTERRGRHPRAGRRGFLSRRPTWPDRASTGPRTYPPHRVLYPPPFGRTSC